MLLLNPFLFPFEPVGGKGFVLIPCMVYKGYEDSHILFSNKEITE
jgi:hypothetical protein